MRLYIASDENHKAQQEWFVGISKFGPERIKSELGFHKRHGSVDILFDCPQGREILTLLKERIGCSEVGGKGDVLLVQGEHSDIADLLMELSKDYEVKHPSLRRSLSRWLTGVESWEKSTEEA